MPDLAEDRQLFDAMMKADTGLGMGGKMRLPGSPFGVYAAIVAVAGALAKDGIGKDRKNAQQGFMFRGIDDVYNALAPLLAQHALCILPRVLGREVTERKTQAGGALFSVTVHVAFDLVCATDGSRHEVVTYGEAMDTGDKATNKAMSAAYKYACLQTFCIPTEGDNDADARTHAVAAAPDGAPLTTADDIRALAKRKGVDVTKILEAYSVESLEDLDAEQTDQTIRTLRAKKDAKP